MPFNFSKLLGIIKIVANTRTFATAGEIAIKKIGEKIDANANNPEEIKAIAKELITEAPQVIGAMVKDTEAEGLVDPETIHRKNDA